MNGNGFEALIERAFCPFLAELGFSLRSVSITGLGYSAKFGSPEHELMISYDLEIAQPSTRLLTRGADVRAIDDPVLTPTLKALNILYMGSVESADRLENDRFFEPIRPRDSAERAMLKCARELRLVLTRHLRARSTNGPARRWFWPLFRRRGTR